MKKKDVLANQYRLDHSNFTKDASEVSQLVSQSNQKKKKTLNITEKNP